MIWGKKGHCANGIAPASPAACRTEHCTAGCSGNAKIASGCETSLPSPQTEHPVGRTGADVATKTGAAVGAPMSWHSHGPRNKVKN
mmetsp:Transcript_10495/g.12032  ORF Transcript_10495/g.12032 Transcript_10495/m.12032 type:complete len:86 (-) Transcript_10495:357-614(-)